MEAIRFNQLPDFVKTYLTSDEDVEQNRAIQADFLLNQDQFDFVLRVILDAALKRFDVLDLLARLSRMPDTDAIDLKKLALRIATDKLWPMQEHLKKVDVLINRLGGRIPNTKPQAQDDDSSTRELLHGNAKDMLRQHREFNDMLLTQKPMKDIDQRLRAPSVQNWLDEYLHTMGADGGDSMKRSQFLAKSPNASKLNDAEKENLLNFLFSYEDNAPMYWEVAEDQYLIIRATLPEEQMDKIEEKKAQQQLPELVEEYKRIQSEYISIIQEHTKAIEIESDQNTKKLYDVVWDSLGLNEVNRCITAIDLLIEKHAFLEMLKIDQRFKGILARELTVRYGTEASRVWNNDATTNVMLSIFWDLLLHDKLGLDEHRAAVLADYFRKKLQKEVSPIYLDLKKQQFLFRGVEYANKEFSFAD